ncbi:hypothetical protein HRbin40_00275 [bacterium HR40]|nr:hypothetical protein HRbin40_00275 [bacterium HR40]
MTRILLTATLPFLLPFVVWLAWGSLTRRGRPSLESVPWYGLTMTGLVAMCASLIALALVGGHAPNRYTSPRLESSRVLPAMVEPIRHEQH